jgi:hypothetical protein
MSASSASRSAPAGAIAPRIEPADRMWRVSARVSTPLIATIPFRAGTAPAIPSRASC